MRKVARDVDDFGPGERLPAHDDEEGDAQLVRLRDDAPQLLRGQLVRSIAPDGLGIAALAAKVAPIGDTENCYRGNGEPVRRVARACPCRPALPENGPRKEECLAGMPQAHSDELGEEDAKTPVEGRGRGHSCGHGFDDLLRQR
jgi:hypothetical protein